jgi:hypothetical protein
MNINVLDIIGPAMLIILFICTGTGIVLKDGDILKKKDLIPYIVVPESIVLVFAMKFYPAIGEPLTIGIFIGLFSVVGHQIFKRVEVKKVDKK